MKIDVLPLGLYEENIYLIHENGHVLIVDPGCHRAREILKYISKDEKADAIVLTHGHEDHTYCVDDLADELGCPVYMHPLDLPLVQAASSGAKPFSRPVYTPLKDLLEGKMTLGTFKVQIYHTPGHTAGSVCVRYRDVLITGDTLFAGSIGRTDLYSGNDAQMSESLLKLKQLPGNLTICPGHGPASTLADEFRHNRYVLYYLKQIDTEPED
ncbi:MAG: MBL fold metallo-hydrolase [Solobacterium sp.]|nr:MBL fold metallo-hydrolase [Solobacterium sp.]